jgi:hypothetical protein
MMDWLAELERLAKTIGALPSGVERANAKGALALFVCANLPAILAMGGERDALRRDVDRLRENLKHSHGRFLNINICLSSGGTKREAIAIADLGEDCIKGYLDYHPAPPQEKPDGLD